jgi:hypothetical protein
VSKPNSFVFVILKFGRLDTTREGGLVQTKFLVSIQNQKSPPFEGGEPASLSEQAGWFRSYHVPGTDNHPASLRSAPLLLKEGIFHA